MIKLDLTQYNRMVAQKKLDSISSRLVRSSCGMVRSTSQYVSKDAARRYSKILRTSGELVNGDISTIMNYKIQTKA